MCLNCHVVAVDVEINDLEAVRKACKTLGWTFVENKTSYKWFGKWVDDSPVPRHLFEHEEEYQKVLAMPKEERKNYMTWKLGVCDHAIQIPGVQYELGLIQRGDKYIPIWDWFHPSMNAAMGEAGCNFLKPYAIHRAELEAQRMCYPFTTEALENGNVQVRVQIPDY